MQKLAICCSIE